MMDVDVSNIVYIVLTLVVVIISVLGKKKKPGSTVPGAQRRASRPSFMENLERVLSAGQEEPGILTLDPDEDDLAGEATSSEEVPEVSAFQKERQKYLEDYNRIMNRNSDGDPNRIQSEGESSSGPMEIIDLDSESNADFFEMIENFDAKTAIVYASIINRLDY
jgi:hypothetical protein